MITKMRVGDTYRTRSGVKLKIIAIARDGREKDRRSVVFINKDTFRKEAPGQVWTSGISAFAKLVSMGDTP